MTSGSAPLLLSIPSMKGLGVIVDFLRGVARLEALGLELPLIKTRTNRRGVSIVPTATAKEDRSAARRWM